MASALRKLSLLAATAAALRRNLPTEGTEKIKSQLETLGSTTSGDVEKALVATQGHQTKRERSLEGDKSVSEIFREDFEEPNQKKSYQVCSNCQPVLQGWMNPAHPSYVSVAHPETGGQHMTVFGYQRCPGKQSCGAETLNSPGLTLEANTRYILTFDVSAGAQNMLGDYEVQLCALLDEHPAVWVTHGRYPENKKLALASTRGLATKMDFSESGRIEYLSPAASDLIGRQLVMRFLDTDYTNWRNTPAFDNVRLTKEEAGFLSVAGTILVDLDFAKADSWMQPGDTSAVLVKSQGTRQYLNVVRGSACGQYVNCGAETVGSQEFVLESDATYILSYEVGAAMGALGDYEVQLAVMTNGHQAGNDPERSLWPLATRSGLVKGIGSPSERHELVYTVRNARDFVGKRIVFGLLDAKVGAASNAPIFGDVRLTMVKGGVEDREDGEDSEDGKNGK